MVNAQPKKRDSDSVTARTSALWKLYEERRKKTGEEQEIRRREHVCEKNENRNQMGQKPDYIRKGKKRRREEKKRKDKKSLNLKDKQKVKLD